MAVIDVDIFRGILLNIPISAFNSFRKKTWSYYLIIQENVFKFLKEGNL